MAFSVKLTIAHTTVIKWKEKYDAVVVECHHGDRIKMSLPEKKNLRETPTSPWVPFSVKFQPLG